MGGIARSDRGGDPAPDVPDRRNAEASWLKAFDQVVQDRVRNIFMKDAFVAEAPQVELQALQLQDLRSWHIGDGEDRKVGLAGHRADAREFRADALNLIVPIGMRVGYDHQVLRGFRRHGGVYALNKFFLAVVACGRDSKSSL